MANSSYLAHIKTQPQFHRLSHMAPITTPSHSYTASQDLSSMTSIHSAVTILITPTAVPFRMIDVADLPQGESAYATAYPSINTYIVDLALSTSSSRTLPIIIAVIVAAVIAVLVICAGFALLYLRIKRICRISHVFSVEPFNTQKQPVSQQQLKAGPSASRTSITREQVLNFIRSLDLHSTSLSLPRRYSVTHINAIPQSPHPTEQTQETVVNSITATNASDEPYRRTGDQHGAPPAYAQETPSTVA